MAAQLSMDNKDEIVANRKSERKGGGWGWVGLVGGFSWPATRSTTFLPIYKFTRKDIYITS